MPITSENVLRVVRFRPYRKGDVFRLIVWDTGRTKAPNHNRLGYRLSIGRLADQNAIGNPAVWKVLFEGEDFGSPAHLSVDSDETVKGIMSFLTLRPGDTDREYFADYTPAQLAYCSEHAEALSSEVLHRFGE